MKIITWSEADVPNAEPKPWNQKFQWFETLPHTCDGSAPEERLKGDEKWCMEGQPEFGGIHPAASTIAHAESLQQQPQQQQQHPHHSQFQLQVQLPSHPSDLMGTLDQWPPALGFPTASFFQHCPPGQVPPFPAPSTPSPLLPLVPTSIRTEPVPPSPGTRHGTQRLSPPLSPPHNYLAPIWASQSIPQQDSIPFQQLPPPLSDRPHSHSTYCGSLRDRLFHPPAPIQLPPGCGLNPAQEYELSTHGIVHSPTYQLYKPYQTMTPFQQPVMIQPPPPPPPAPASARYQFHLNCFNLLHHDHQ